MSNSAFTPTFAQNLQDASATQKGLVNTTTQTFAGKKTFDGGAAIKGDTSGNAVAAGYVGEKVDWGGLLTTSDITATGQEVGNGTARITLQPGIYLVSYSGDVAGSDSTVQSALVLGTVSGTATIANIGQYFSSVQGSSSGTFYGFTGLNYVIVSSATVIRVVSEVLNGGTLSSCRLIKGAAIRIA